MLIRSIIILLCFLIQIPIYAQSVGEPYSPHKFIEIFGSNHTEGEIEKIIRLKNKAGNFFMILSKKVVIDQQTEVDNIYAYGFNEISGVLKEEWRFKDFGNSIYWPRFYVKESEILDADGDGIPECVVAYFGSSDGLDAKPLKIITYIEGVKYKATALYPAGNEDDVYHIIYDKNWKTMPKPTQIYVNKLFKQLKPLNLYEYK